MNARTKVHLKWDRELTEYLKNIAWCELCGSRFLLSKAHRLKRRFIGYKSDFDKKEYFMAAKLCAVCHTSLDEATGEDVHKRMFDTITKIIVKRNPRLLEGDVIIHPILIWSPLEYEEERKKYGF